MFREYLNRIIRRIDLSDTQMSQMISDILTGTIPDTQIAAFMGALATKGETYEELAGAAQAMRRHAVRVHCHASTVIDTCGTGGDGLNTFNISTTTAFVVAGCGVTVAKHGNRSVSSKCGSADLLEALGLRLDIDPESITWLEVSMPPYLIQDGPYKTEGYGSMVSAILREHMPEYDHQVIVTNVIRHFDRFKKGEQVCSIGLYRTPEREAFMHFSIPSLLTMPAVLITTKDKLAQFGESRSIKLGEVLANPRFILGLSKDRSYGTTVDAILLTIEEKEQGVVRLKGSGRSVPGINLFQMLERSAAHVEQFGGHAMAVGLTMAHDDLERFAEALHLAAGELAGEGSIPALTAEHHCIDRSTLNRAFVRALQVMQPFGEGNPEPVFLLKGERLLEQKTVNGHLLFQVRVNGMVLRGIGFNLAEGHGQRSGPVDLFFKIKKTWFRGSERDQLQAIHQAGPVPTP